ncbi:AbrB family transcriptional regulator [Falsirhodobacter sp. 20TX0035]|uniref:AbrB family transcriptional regulator n=1 Tax=Falsirhodobacter sp. 20TX0035 TaxID=3022019 RepID=UPI00233099D0|nr:AbrB family transcriptional regulator [Falsirhodobacter sp. 20TX0035]MDB6455085.1 AbrB family transcriptional regulator [Falsirhodobacter sp. 20TX0035]
MNALGKVAGSLVIATLGGVVFRHLDIPLPWILGALTGAALWVNMAGPAPGGRFQRRAAQLLLGTGSAAILTLKILSEMLGVLPLMLLAALIANGAAFLAAPIFARVSRLTALLAVLAAGLAEMSSLAEECRARPDIVALSHSVRVALIVIFVPMVLGTNGVAGTAPAAGGSPVALVVCLGARLTITSALFGEKSSLAQEAGGVR